MIMHCIEHYAVSNQLFISKKKATKKHFDSIFLYFHILNFQQKNLIICFLQKCGK
jgi:hypothetical protein